MLRSFLNNNLFYFKFHSNNIEKSLPYICPTFVSNLISPNGGRRSPFPVRIYLVCVPSVRLLNLISPFTQLFILNLSLFSCFFLN